MKERTWWKDQFVKGGELPGFGWMPPVDPKKVLRVRVQLSDLGFGVSDLDI